MHLSVGYSMSNVPPNFNRTLVYSRILDGLVSREYLESFLIRLYRSFVSNSSIGQAFVVSFTARARIAEPRMDG